MHFLRTVSVIAIAAFAVTGAAAQTADKSADDTEQLRITALEALASAPPEKALPIADKVLRGDYSKALKKRALFILSQVETPEAQQMLLDTAKTGSEELRSEAIRMIGIGGDPAALAGLKEIHASGDADVREAVLEAYLIADDAESVYQIAIDAKNAKDEDEFEEAVNILGAMEARDELRRLRDQLGSSEELINAYSVAGDFESLRELAMDNTKPEQQVHALRGLGVVGGERANTTLLEIYRATDSPDVKEAALEGMLISEYDEGVLLLFRESKDAGEKQRLLRTLVNMDSDAVMEIIESTFDGAQ
ncbi:MAG TPA: HEAT repeat domain-containing protein [Woeseiaceae bacterium]|nr:HEAT repeat domain-containing protein [Woeseiaceae bacterium]